MNWVRVRTFPTLPEAWLAHTALLHEGLAVEIRGESRAPLAGELPFPDARVELWVIAEHAEMAEAILSEIDRVGEGPPRKCKCGEENPPAFEVCWSCGRPLA